MERIVIIAENDTDMRMDVYLTKETEYTRSYIDKLNKSGNILVNGSTGKSGRMLRNLDVIEITLPEKSSNILPEDIPLDIIYEDEDIAVINKQRGISVHPSGNVVSGTLVNALLYHMNNLSNLSRENTASDKAEGISIESGEEIIRPGIVHRLDKDTTGIMVIAKNDKSHVSISSQLASRTVRKIYLGILEGNLKQDTGRIVTGIGRHPKNRKLMSVISGGREAITKYKVLERFENNCLVEFELLTGRTHQIRVHAKHLGNPLVGDAAYGYIKQRFELEGQLLHSYELTITHPTKNTPLTFTAPPPQDFEEVLSKLKAERE